MNTEQRVGNPVITSTLIPWTNLILPVCNKSQWKINRPNATNATPLGNTLQNKLNDSSVTAFVIGTGPVSVITRPLDSQPLSSAN